MLTHQQGESDRGELQYPFGLMEQFPRQLAAAPNPVPIRSPVVRQESSMA